MADIDLSNMSVNQLQDLINKAQEQKFMAENAARDEAAARKERIKSAVTNLSALLGPVDAQPGMDSIRAVRAYGDDVIAANPGQAVALALLGLEQLTGTVLDLAKTISEA